MLPITKTFRITQIKEPYQIRLVGDDKTIDDAWLTEKCWFLPGDKVMIEDEDGDRAIFVKR